MAGPRAVLLVGGLGTRLRPLTHEVPKPLVPIANRALISYPLAMLARGGADEAILACGYKADALREGLARLGDVGLTVRVVEEEQALDTAGAVRNAVRHADQPLIVMNGDLVMDVAVEQVLAFHEERHADLTIVVRRVPDVSAFGLVPCAADGRVQDFGEKRPSDPTGQNLINAGMYVFSPGVLDEIPVGKPYSNERQLFPGLIRAGRPVFAFPMQEQAFWVDVGTPQNYLYANAQLLNGVLRGADVATVSSRAKVSPESNLIPPVSLAADCAIEAGTEVGPHVSVGERAIVRRGAAVRDSILWPAASVGEGCCLANVIVGPGFRVPPGTRLAAETAAILAENGDGDDAG